MLQCCPCGNLDAHSDPVRCEIARSFPADCPGCAAYVAGQTADDRIRMDAWRPVLDRLSGGSTYEAMRFHAIEAKLERQDKAIRELTGRMAHLLAEIQTLRGAVQGN